MGTPSDPENPDYEIGNECTACIDLFAPGQTPKFVSVSIKDVIPCPPLEELPPGFGDAVLEQNPAAPCQWEAYIDRDGVAHDYVFTLNLPGVPGSSFTYDRAGFPMFAGRNISKCSASFDNELKCALGDLVGEGTAGITWGPNGG